MSFVNVTFNGPGLETFGNSWNPGEALQWSLSPLNVTTFGFLVDLADIYSDCEDCVEITYVECEC